MEHTKEELKAIKDDFYRYCAENLYIVNVKAQLIKLVPNNIQRVLINHALKCLIKGEPIRMIVLKARKEGVSTIIEALMYWWTATHKNITSRIVAHEKDSASTIYQMFQRYYENTSPFFKPQRKYSTRKDLTFDTDDGKGLKSSMSIATAESLEVGRGDTIFWLHASEVGSWKKGSRLMAGLLNAVPYEPETAIIEESTANGMGGYFYDEWQAAKEGLSNFTPFFFAWFDHAEYRMPTDEFFRLTDQEKEWKQTYNLDNEQLNWYRHICRQHVSDPDLVKQEFPFNDTEAFLASGRPRFKTDILAEMERNARPPKYYEVFEKDEDIQLVPAELTPLKVWQLPRENRQYTIGVDVAEGLEKGDKSVIDIMDKESIETVARWRGIVEPADLGDITEMLGRVYNHALVGVEANNHGLTVIQRLRDRRYDNMYRRERGFDERLEQATARLGWLTTSKTKPLAINSLAEAIHTRKLKDYDIVFIRECLTYVVDSLGRTSAQEGKFDDTVMAKAINLQMFEWDGANRSRLIHSKLPRRNMARKGRNRHLLRKSIVKRQGIKV